ncbi:MAG TPA: ribosomal protein S18-alanine N-acetyltransferase [Candidatus Hydrogenedens sp.]|nr:ribosomal protein S18-alanine N-acetyltransferase [Candidatus Hydrogenedens sp.]
MSEPYDIIISPQNVEINVFLLEEEHVDRVHAMEVESYPDAWSRELFLPEINNRAGKFFVFFIEDSLIGYAGYWLGGEEAHITKFTVAPAYRRQGLGTFFMNYLFEQVRKEGAQRIILEVREMNYPARSLYEKMGFHTIGIRIGYYARTLENAVVMVRYLNEESDKEDIIYD